MSGGFFRGTSADQDTRFSNKQAKLLKSQKFAPELEQLVDITRVKMDVIRPWIANRVTELLGFEDEVLINFIYGLLDGKEIDGKQIQIQLTGFMEKNTGRFMKELWGLLLNAQRNVSGVPQQFLDAKEEETRKKKEEADRITTEIQKKREKEGREFELEKQRKMDGEPDILRVKNAASDANSKHPLLKSSRFSPNEEREADERHALRGKNGFSNSPHSLNHSPTTCRISPSPTRSSSKSFSNSRSYSDERRESRSISPQPRKRSISRERRYRSPRRRFISPRRRYSPRNPRSPSKRRSPCLRRRSTSRSQCRSLSPMRHRSASPIRRRSPSSIRHRSPSSIRRRSPSPMRRRSPPSARWRSPSPPQRRPPSPLSRRYPPSARWRSPSPLQRRSPFPLRRRSPVPHRRSPSPSRRRSPSKWRSRSPQRCISLSPFRGRSPLPRSPRNRRRSPERLTRRHAVDSPRQRNRRHSPLHRSRRSLTSEHNRHVNGVESRRIWDDDAFQRKASPIHRSLEEDEVPYAGSGQKGSAPVSRQPPISLRSPQCDPRDRSDGRCKKPQSSRPPDRSPKPSESPPHIQQLDPTEDGSQSESPSRQTIEWATRHDGLKTSREEDKIICKRDDIGHGTDYSRKRNKNLPGVGSRIKSTSKDSEPEEESQEFAVGQSTVALAGPDHAELRKKDRHDESDNASPKTDFHERRRQRPGSSVEIENGPARLEREGFTPNDVYDEQPSVLRHARYSSSPDEGLSGGLPIEKRSHLKENHIVDKRQQPYSSNDEDSDPGHKTETAHRSARKVNRIDHAGSYNSDSDRNDSRSRHLEKRKPESHLDDDYGHDLQKDERKEAKGRRKEEKRLRKEEKCRRREERHRRREERRAGKLKTRSMDTVTPRLDFGKNQNDAVDSDGDAAMRRSKHPSDSDETESEQKKLEIELRKKALESLLAKKAVGH